MRARITLLLLLIVVIAFGALNKPQELALAQSSTPASASQPAYTVKIDFNPPKTGVNRQPFEFEYVRL